MKSVTLIILFLITTFNYSFGQVKNPNDDGRKIRIPVVFHVLHNNDAENIHDSLILNELGDLNLDFSISNDMSLLVSDFQSIVGNPNIEFYLLDTVLQETGIKGVQRISKSKIKNESTLLINLKNCLNVFIAKQGNSSGILSDRVNLNFKDVGTYSHVLTHETGHWLGLYHIWGKAGNSSFIRLVTNSHDDEIDDTPKQWEATAICYTISDSCPCPPEVTTYKKHKTLYNNFMDYNPCRCMFTLGQSTQMRNNIIESKPTFFNTE